MSNNGPIEHVIIAFDTTSAAFTHPISQEPDNYYLDLEVRTIMSRILTKIVDRGIGDLHDVPILDANGNTVGVITITRSKE